MCGVVPSLLSRFKDVKKEKKRRTRKLSRDFYARKPKPAWDTRPSLPRPRTRRLFSGPRKKKEIPLLKGAQRLCAFRDDERVRGRTRSGKERVHRGRRGRERGGVGRKSARASEDDYAGAGKKGKSFSSIWERFSKRDFETRGENKA